MNTSNFSDVSARSIAASAPVSVGAFDAASAEIETRVGHLAATGFGIGGTVGALIGAVAVGIAAMTTDLVLPGSSLAMAGPLSAMLLGAGAGAANGGLAGALIGWGIPVEVPAELSTPARSLGQSLRTVLCPHAK